MSASNSTTRRVLAVKSLTEVLKDPETLEAIRGAIALLQTLGNAMATPIKGMYRLGEFFVDYAENPDAALRELTGVIRTGTTELNPNYQGADQTFFSRRRNRYLLERRVAMQAAGERTTLAANDRLGIPFEDRANFRDPARETSLAAVGALEGYSGSTEIAQIQEELRGTYRESQTLYERLNQWADTFGNKTDRVAGVLGGGMVNSISAVTQGLIGMGDAGQSMGDRLLAVLAAVLQRLLEIQITSFVVSSFFGGGSPVAATTSNVGSSAAGGALAAARLRGRATGGPTAVGETFLVGERGPELFVPDSPGRIFPHHDIGGSLHRAGGSAPVVLSQQITINAGVSQTVRAEVYGMLPQLRALSIDAIREARARGDL